jgi:hypothetical protein
VAAYLLGRMTTGIRGGGATPMRRPRRRIKIEWVRGNRKEKK